MQPTLVASNLTKTIAGKVIVDSLSFETFPGEVFGFLGPNGAGKTTTIRMLVGLIRPTRGMVTICGHDVRREFEKAMRCIGCMVETPDLYKFMTGRENLEHFSRMLGKVNREQIEHVAGLVSLAHRLDHRVGTYSLGMRQRLGIAQALLGSPRVLILDEPANGLDPAGIREIRGLLRSLASEGMSILVSSHLLAEIELMCDRVAIIHKGKMVTSGKVSDLISSTRSLEIRVDDPTRAVDVAKSHGYSPSVDEDTLRFAIDESLAPPLIAALVENGVAVFHATAELQTLEEMFIEATGGESVAT